MKTNFLLLIPKSRRQVVGTHASRVLHRRQARGTRAYQNMIGVIVAAMLAVSFMLAPRTRACGPFFTDAIFVFTKHPDFPLENFATGKLGVVNPSWARSYLVVAYRTLSGNALSATESKAMKRLWDDRLNGGSDLYDESWVKKWNEARARVPGAPQGPEIQIYRNREKPREYESFLNCQGDAFTTAESTLSDRIAKFGADSRQVRDWLAAQDAVFANCYEGRHMPAAATSDDALVKADRAYQIAAANFYSTNFDEAKQQFDSIAKDQKSPWRAIAAYLAARSMLRKGSFMEKPEEGRPFLAEAETRLNAVLKDSSMKTSHHAAGRLLNLVRVRLHPEEKVHELGRAILSKDRNQDFKQTVWDYTILLDKYLEREDDSTPLQLPANFTSDELTDWIATFEGDTDNNGAHAVQQWEKTKSAAWLVAALATADSKQPKLNELLSAAASFGPTSAAYPSVVFHSVRLLKEAGRVTEARSLLDKTLAGERTGMSDSAINMFLSQRMMLAQNLDQFLQDAPRIPAGFSDDNDGREIPDDPANTGEITKGSKFFFDIDAANSFNKTMPVAVMRDAALSRLLVPNLRRDVAQAAFVRAALLDDREAANQAATVVKESYPETGEFLTAYQRAATPEARRFAAAFLSLKFPGLRPYVTAGVGRSTPVNDIDSYRDNYWCTEPAGPFGGAFGTGGDTKPKPVPAPDFLKAAQPAAARQVAALQALGTAPNYFCRIAIDWATKNPTDPRAPEALHLAVRSTRYGCTDQETGRWSKAAYDLLHRKYPNTTWAKNTKYWFK